MRNKILLLTIIAIFAVGCLYLSKKDPETNAPTYTPTSTSETCIIIVDGNKYDVTSFRDRHEGGNVFICGSDMSEAFHNQHNDRVLREVERYRI